MELFPRWVAVLEATRRQVCRALEIDFELETELAELRKKLEENDDSKMSTWSFFSE